MRLDVVVREVVHIVGGDRRHAELVGQVREFGIDLLLLAHPVVLQLDEEPVGTEDVEVRLGHLLGGGVIDPQQLLRHFAADAAAGADQPVGKLAQRGLVNPRLVVEPLEVADAGELHQVAVAGQVHRQQQQVIAGLAQPLGLF